MTSHELARKLMELPDLPVAVHSMGHTYTFHHKPSHGPLEIGLIETATVSQTDYARTCFKHIAVGNMLKESLKHGNESLKKILYEEPRS